MAQILHCIWQNVENKSLIIATTQQDLFSCHPCQQYHPCQQQHPCQQCRPCGPPLNTIIDTTIASTPATHPQIVAASIWDTPPSLLITFTNFATPPTYSSSVQIWWLCSECCDQQSYCQSLTTYSH